MLCTVYSVHVYVTMKRNTVLLCMGKDLQEVRQSYKKLKKKTGDNTIKLTKAQDSNHGDGGQCVYPLTSQPKVLTFWVRKRSIYGGK